MSIDAIYVYIDSYIIYIELGIVYIEILVFPDAVTSDVVLTDRVGSILIVLATGIWSSSTKVTAGHSIFIIRDGMTVDFSLSTASETLFVMSSLEKPRRVH